MLSFFSRFNKNNNNYPYEIKKRSVNAKQKLKQQKKKGSNKKKLVKNNSGRKRYGQNNINKKSFLKKRKTINENYSSWNNTSKQQKLLNKFKHKIKNKSLKGITFENSIHRSNNESVDSKFNGNNTENMSEDCRTVFDIMKNWNITRVDIDLSEEKYYNKTNIEIFPCCYNNNFVVCEDNKIVELNFEENEIEGEIPEDICKLTDLTKLFLGTNRLYGSIPKNIGNLKNLEYLWLYYNNLNGTIPTSIGELSNLKSLNLHGNDFSGTIPEEIGKLTNLETLDLHNNNFQGDIPSSLKDLPALKRLYLNYNQLDINNVTFISDSLEKCDFKNNNMTESVSDKYDSLPCTSAAIPNISIISIQGILIFLIINLIFYFK